MGLVPTPPTGRNFPTDVSGALFALLRLHVVAVEFRAEFDRGSRGFSSGSEKARVKVVRVLTDAAINACWDALLLGADLPVDDAKACLDASSRSLESAQAIWNRLNTADGSDAWMGLGGEDPSPDPPTSPRAARGSLKEVCVALEEVAETAQSTPGLSTLRRALVFARALYLVGVKSPELRGTALHQIQTLRGEHATDGEQVVRDVLNRLGHQASRYYNWRDKSLSRDPS